MRRLDLRNAFGRRAVPILAGVLLVAALIIGILGQSVVSDLRLLGAARSDNVQWSLSQTEVEFLELGPVIDQIVEEPAPNPVLLRDLRVKFDVFYSRISTIRKGSLYENLRANPYAASALADLQVFLDDSVPLIDGSDGELHAAAPELLARYDEARPKVRDLSVSGLRVFAVASDERREQVAATLIQLATVTAILLGVLALLALYFIGLSATSERQRRDLEETSSRMRTVIDTALDAVIVADADGRITHFNSAAEVIFGYDAKDAIGEFVGELIVPAHHRAGHAAGMKRMRTSGEKRVVGHGRVQLEARRANGEVFPVELAIQSADTASGEIFIAFLRDISHRVKAEAELVMARDRALAGEKAKAGFLAVMSHEIRTPLNGIMGNLSLLRETRLDERQARFLEDMDLSSRLLLHHVNDVLDISRLDAGKMALEKVPVNFSSLVQDIVDTQRGAAEAAGNRLELSWLGPPLAWVSTDPVRIGQVLLNLIGNAIKFTDGGRISLECEVLFRRGEEAVTEVRVIDTGIGIPEDDIERIFEDFETRDVSYSRKSGGTGLGLGIARRIVTALGGEMGAESSPGEGSLFWVRLPLVTTQKPKEQFAIRLGAKAPVTSVTPRDVLVVEDNPINRAVAREMLQSDGHRVTEAVDGAEGVRLAASHPFDLILMDISMPRMDGRQATAAIRSGRGASRDVPIVALTANVLPEDVEGFLADGMTDALAKPLDREALRRILGRTESPRARTLVQSPRSAVGQILDVDQFASAQDSLGQAGIELLLPRFLDEGEELVDWLLGALGGPTIQPEVRFAIAERAHNSAGSAATFGAAALREALVSLERAAKAEHALDAHIGAIGPIWKATETALRAKLDR